MANFLKFNWLNVRAFSDQGSMLSPGLFPIQGSEDELKPCGRNLRK